MENLQNMDYVEIRLNYIAMLILLLFFQTFHVFLFLCVWWASGYIISWYTSENQRITCGAVSFLLGLQGFPRNEHRFQACAANTFIYCISLIALIFLILRL